MYHKKDSVNHFRLVGLVRLAKWTKHSAKCQNHYVVQLLIVLAMQLYLICATLRQIIYQVPQLNG